MSWALSSRLWPVLYGPGRPSAQRAQCPSSPEFSRAVSAQLCLFFLYSSCSGNVGDSYNLRGKLVIGLKLLRKQPPCFLGKIKIL